MYMNIKHLIKKVEVQNLKLLITVVKIRFKCIFEVTDEN